MPFANLNGWHLIIVLAVVLLLFGAPKLPALARSVGQSMRIFRSEVKTMKDESADDAAADAEPVDDTAPAASATTPAKSTASAKSTSARSKS